MALPYIAMQRQSQCKICTHCTVLTSSLFKISQRHKGIRSDNSTLISGNSFQNTDKPKKQARPTWVKPGNQPAYSLSWDHPVNKIHTMTRRIPVGTQTKQMSLGLNNAHKTGATVEIIVSVYFLPKHVTLWRTLHWNSLGVAIEQFNTSSLALRRHSGHLILPHRRIELDNTQSHHKVPETYICPRHTYTVVIHCRIKHTLIIKLKIRWANRMKMA